MEFIKSLNAIDPSYSVLGVTFIMFVVFSTMARHLQYLAVDSRKVDKQKNTVEPSNLLEDLHPTFNYRYVILTVFSGAVLSSFMVETDPVMSVFSLAVVFALNVTYLGIRLSRIQVVRMDQHSLSNVRIARAES